MKVMKIVCHAFLHSCFQCMSILPNGKCLFRFATFSLVGDSSLVHKLRVMAAVVLHLNATNAQHPALKLVHEKH